MTNRSPLIYEFHNEIKFLASKEKQEKLLETDMEYECHSVVYWVINFWDKIKKESDEPASFVRKIDDFVLLLERFAEKLPDLYKESSDIRRKLILNDPYWEAIRKAAEKLSKDPSFRHIPLKGPDKGCVN